MHKLTGYVVVNLQFNSIQLGRGVELNWALCAPPRSHTRGCPLVGSRTYFSRCPLRGMSSGWVMWLSIYNSIQFDSPPPGHPVRSLATTPNKTKQIIYLISGPGGSLQLLLPALVMKRRRTSCSPLHVRGAALWDDTTPFVQAYAVPLFGALCAPPHSSHSGARWWGSRTTDFSR